MNTEENNSITPPPVPENLSNQPLEEYTSKIVGVTYLNTDGTSRASIISEITSENPIRLIREPFNQHDINAIRVEVLLGNGWFQIGYIQSDLSNIIAQKIDNGFYYEASIENCGIFSTDENKYLPYCKIRIKRNPEFEKQIVEQKKQRIEKLNEDFDNAKDKYNLLILGTIVVGIILAVILFVCKMPIWGRYAIVATIVILAYVDRKKEKVLSIMSKAKQTINNEIKILR